MAVELLSFIWDRPIWKAQALHRIPPLKGATSLNLGKPKHGARNSTGVPHHSGHGCRKRQAVSSARIARYPWSLESWCRSSPAL